MKAMREVERIYALAKTWHRLVPNEKRPNFEAAADAVLNVTRAWERWRIRD